MPDMLLPVLLLLVTVNGVTSERFLQTGNVRSKIWETNKRGDLQLANTNDSVPRQSYSGDLESEEPLLYAFFPAGFIWGAATSALQV